MSDRARRRAVTAVSLDGMWVVVFVIALPNHVLAAAIGAAVLALGLLSMRVRRLGYIMTVLRGFVAFILLIVGAVTTALLLLSVAAATSAVLGFAATRAPRSRRSRSERFDEIGSAIIHLAFVALMLVALLAQGRVAAAVGFVLFWAALTWGTIAVHEAGHAVAALRSGNAVPNVRIGAGLTLFRVGPVSVGAIPFLGHTHWAANESSMTIRREAYIALSGPAANLVGAFAFLAIYLVLPDSLVLALVGAHVATALLNLVPFEHGVHGQRMSSDGARALRLLGAK